MEDIGKEFDKKADKLIREEARLFLRLKDTVRKYRMLLPFISGNAERLEDKIARLMSNCEESENALRKIKSRIAHDRSIAMEIDKKLLYLDSSRRLLVSRYNSILSGRMPLRDAFTSAASSIDELTRKREEFLSNISDEFRLIETEMQALDRRRDALAQKKAAMEEKICKKENNAKVIDKKVALYQSDIRLRLKELNDQVKNEKRITSEYSLLISKLKEAPDLSNWPAHMVKEAIRHSRPKAKIIDLQNPMSTN
ncbi:MAG: hypothetical protein ACE5EN_06725 [Nitrospinota bacterium]